MFGNCASSLLPWRISPSLCNTSGGYGFGFQTKLPQQKKENRLKMEPTYLPEYPTYGLGPVLNRSDELVEQTCDEWLQDGG